MKRLPLRWLIPILLLLLISAALWYAMRPKPVAVKVTRVERGRVERTVANTRAGTVKACRRAKLSPSIGGQISRLPIKEGDRVREGQLLLELWNEDLRAQLKLAKNEADTARAQASATCLNAGKARREADRLLKLSRIGAASEENTDTAVTRAKATEADCRAARATVSSREANIGVIQANLDRTRLTAPFAGVIAEINGELDEFVTPSPIGIPTPPAVDLIDTSCFYITAPIDEVDAPGIQVGMPARVSLDAFGNRHFAGKVRRIADYVLDREKQARTVDVEVSFASPDDIKELLAGYSADVEILLEAHDHALRIPTEAVMEQDEVFVYLPREKRLAKRKIEKGISNWDFTEVVRGLAAGDLVVTNADRTGFKDGAPARLAGEKQ